VKVAGGPLTGLAITRYRGQCCNVTKLPVEYFQNLTVRGHYEESRSTVG